MINNDLRDYINWQDYNHLIKKTGTVPQPMDDSKGDSAEDEMSESIMGKNFPEEEVKESDEDTALASTPSAARKDGLEEHLEGQEASARPGPLADLNKISSTH